MRSKNSAGLLLVPTLVVLGCAQAGSEPATRDAAVSLAEERSTTAASPEPGPATTSTSAQESHVDGWQAFLEAMRSGDLERVQARTTEAGYASLMRGVGDEDPAVTFARWGEGWSNFEIRWQSTTDIAAQAFLGPEVKEHGIWLVNEGATWKLDRWTPGD